MTNQQLRVVSGLINRLGKLDDAASDLFFKEHGFLDGGKYTELSEEDKKKEDQIHRDTLAVLKALNDFLAKVIPPKTLKQGDLL